MVNNIYDINICATLQKIADNTDIELAYVVNGKITNIRTGEEIPVDHMIYQRIPVDGAYELSPHICSTSSTPCKIGSRWPNNKEAELIPDYNGNICSMSTKRKCGVWKYYELIDLSDLDIDTLLKLINRRGKNIITTTNQARLVQKHN